MTSKRKKSKPKAGKSKRGKKVRKTSNANTSSLSSGGGMMGAGSSVATIAPQPGDTPIPLMVNYQGPVPSDAKITGQDGDTVLNRINNILVGGNGVFIFRNNGDIYVRRV